MIPKFRSWVENVRHPKYSFMQYEPEFNGEINKIFEKNGEIQHGVKVSYMQSTGLKDKNGVEIFEGDVVIGHQYSTTAVQVPFEIKGLVRYSKRNTMFYLDEKSFGHDKFMHSLGSSIYQFEVIGNVFANPELVEVEG
ncbi:YopX family protein [Enterococcus gilvus]|uniref:YopX family protein n=1 Tax=Enterococcus gilvus TaxID=160453 RepID=UPI00345E263E